MLNSGLKQGEVGSLQTKAGVSLVAQNDPSGLFKTSIDLLLDSADRVHVKCSGVTKASLDLLSNEIFLLQRYTPQGSTIRMRMRRLPSPFPVPFRKVRAIQVLSAGFALCICGA